jgi:hypothetical protein
MNCIVGLLRFHQAVLRHSNGFILGDLEVGFLVLVLGVLWEGGGGRAVL